MVCVPEQSLSPLLSWAASHQLPGIVCFTAMQAVQMVQTKPVGLIAIGEPPDASFSDTLQALRRVHMHSQFLYVATHAKDLRAIAGPPPGTNSILVLPFTQPETSEILERFWIKTRLSGETLVAGPVRLDLGARTVSVDGIAVKLRGKRFDLLAYLMSNHGRDIPKDEIALAVVKTVRGDPKRVAKDVHAVRCSLGRAAGMIELCTGGYRFTPDAALRPPKSCR